MATFLTVLIHRQDLAVPTYYNFSGRLVHNLSFSFIQNCTGVYILQNTMARVGGEMVPGKKMKN